MRYVQSFPPESPEIESLVGTDGGAMDAQPRLRQPCTGKRAAFGLTVAALLIAIATLAKAAGGATPTSANVGGVVERYDVATGMKCVVGGCRMIKAVHEYSKEKYGHMTTLECMKKCIAWDDDLVTGIFVNYGGIPGFSKPVDTGDGYCYCYGNGYCNVFEDNPNWHALSGLAWVIGQDAQTCSRLITKTTGKWAMHTCVSEKQTLSFHTTVGTARKESWAQEASFPAAAEKEATIFAASHQSADMFTRSQTLAQSIPLKPKENGQVCLWQWQFGFHGPTPNRDFVDTITDHFTQTPSPDMSPQCLPFRFDLKDDTKQTCTESKYKLN